ncbi:MAG: BMP family ABC transporter substrate-binding protein [Actinomycetota bacterium]
MKRQRRFRFLTLTALVLLALSLIAAACGSDGDTNSASSTETETESGSSDDGGAADGDDGDDEADADSAFSDFKVVMILDGSAEDGGWNTTHLRSGRKMEANFPGIDFSFVEEIEPGQEATNAFQDAVDSGADLVIGTTFYQFDMLDIADANPDVFFLTWAGFEDQPNVGHFVQATEDGRYMDGIVAGSLTESNIIGYPVGFPFEEVNRALNAFTLGVKEVNPDAEVRAVYLNTWFDPAIEQQAAEALANAGADVIAHEVGSQVYATVMAQNDGYVIGYTNDWSDFEPDAWASSFLIDWSTYYTEQVEAIIAGEFEPGVSYGGLKEGWIEFAPYGPAVTDETLALIEERKAQIIDGSFDIFAGPIVDNQGNEVIPAGGTIPFEERIACCQWLVEGIVGEIPSS